MMGSSRSRSSAGLHLNIVQFPDGSSIFRMAPPLTITDAELDRGLDILDQALTTVARRN